MKTQEWNTKQTNQMELVSHTYPHTRGGLPFSGPNESTGWIGSSMAKWMSFSFWIFIMCMFAPCLTVRNIRVYGSSRSNYVSYFNKRWTSIRCIVWLRVQSRGNLDSIKRLVENINGGKCLVHIMERNANRKRVTRTHRALPRLAALRCPSEVCQNHEWAGPGWTGEPLTWVGVAWMDRGQPPHDHSSMRYGAEPSEGQIFLNNQVQSQTVKRHKNAKNPATLVSSSSSKDLHHQDCNTSPVPWRNAFFVNRCESYPADSWSVIQILCKSVH